MSTENSVTVKNVEALNATFPEHAKIAARAYEIAEQLGFPCDCEVAHWLQAEAELTQNRPLVGGDNPRPIE